MAVTDWTFHHNGVAVSSQRAYGGSRSLKATGSSIAVATYNDSGQSEDYTGKLRTFVYVNPSSVIGLVANYDPSNNGGFYAWLDKHNGNFKASDGENTNVITNTLNNTPPDNQWIQMRIFIWGDSSQMHALGEWRETINDEWQQLASSATISSPTNTSGVSGICHNPVGFGSRSDSYIDNSAIGPP